MKNKPYPSYFGGKAGNGTIHTILNHIPPHDVYYSLFAGNDAVAWNKKPAAINILYDLNTEVVRDWRKLQLPDFEIREGDALKVLEVLAKATIDIRGYPLDRVFIFLDPPYLMETRKGQVPVYKHEMTKDQHVDLLSQITAMLEYKIMICCYPNPLYEMWLTGWNHTDFYSTIRGGVALERIYYNYELTGELHDYRALGKGFRQREAYNRIKNNMIKKLSRLPESLRNSILEDIEQHFLSK
jgi:hypothetical protein